MPVYFHYNSVFVLLMNLYEICNLYENTDFLFEIHFILLLSFHNKNLT